MGKRVVGAIDLRTGRPIVMLGTKWPSITSKCRILAPPRSTAPICSPSLVKSADKIDGAISMFLLCIVIVDLGSAEWARASVSRDAGFHFHLETVVLQADYCYCAVLDSS